MGLDLRLKIMAAETSIRALTASDGHKSLGGRPCSTLRSLCWPYYLLKRDIT